VAFCSREFFFLHRARPQFGFACAFAFLALAAAPCFAADKSSGGDVVHDGGLVCFRSFRRASARRRATSSVNPETGHASL
jgi:hypothetical protein